MPRITPIKYKKLCRFFEKNGFKFVRQRGDHLIYVKQGINRPLVIPRCNNIPVFVILNNLRAAGISRKDYLEQIVKV